MPTINNHEAQTEFIKGSSVIIDVREPGEFEENHIPGAVNIPSTSFKPEQFKKYEDVKICLICESGNRASQVQQRLSSEGLSNVFLMEDQMCDIRTTKKVTGWTIDRQFRMTLGLLLLTFLALHFLGVEEGIYIPIILATGLTFTSIIDRCYMRMAIARLPWNTNRKS